MLAAGSILEGGDKTSPPPPNPLFNAWGNQASVAKQQGFYPETSHNGVTTYRSNYSPVFNNVVIPNQKEKGHIAFIGSNGRFDIAVRDSKGNILNYIHKGITPDQVQQYVTNAQSGVATRNNSILSHVTPIDVVKK